MDDAELNFDLGGGRRDIVKEEVGEVTDEEEWEGLQFLFGRNTYLEEYGMAPNE